MASSETISLSAILLPVQEANTRVVSRMLAINHYLKECTLLFACIGVLLLSFSLVAAEPAEQQATENAPATTENTSTGETQGVPEEASQSITASTHRSEIKISAPIDQQVQLQSDLDHYLANAEQESTSEIKPLMVGTGEITTLVSPSLSGTDRGLAIILPDWQQSPINPKAINFLRKELPLHGWATVTLLPLKGPVAYPSLELKKALADEENFKALDNYQTELATTMTAVMAMAEDYPGIVLLISQGSNAAQLSMLFDSEKLEKPNAFVMLSSFMPTKIEDQLFAQKLSTTDLSTLDLVLKSDHPLVAPSAVYRKQMADRELKVAYRQKVLYNTRAGYYPTQDLFRQIEGWLRSIGW